MTDEIDDIETDASDFPIDAVRDAADALAVICDMYDCQLDEYDSAVDYKTLTRAVLDVLADHLGCRFYWADRDDPPLYDDLSPSDGDSPSGSVPPSA